MIQSPVYSVNIKKVNASGVNHAEDCLAVEEPLEIRIAYTGAAGKTVKNISITMRTPGNDKDLAVGFLFTEGILKKPSDVLSVSQSGLDGNIMTIELDDALDVDLKKLERHFYTSSSCGVCGKTSIDAVKTLTEKTEPNSGMEIESSVLTRLPDLLRKQQSVFESTGGLHASALFDPVGQLLMLREDVGRHNALDKLVGAALEQHMIPLKKVVLLLSGRASFELIQKAAMAGIPFVAAVGAPSSLAVELAKESAMTLVGFLRNERFNIYCGSERIVI